MAWVDIDPGLGDNWAEIYGNYVYDQNGNIVYDQNGNPMMTQGGTGIATVWTNIV